MVPLFIIMFIDLVTAAVKWILHYFGRDGKDEDVAEADNGENSENKEKETIDLNNNTNL